MMTEMAIIITMKTKMVFIKSNHYQNLNNNKNDYQDGHNNKTIKVATTITTRRSLGRAQSPTMNGLQYYNNLMGDLIEYNGSHLEFTKDKYCYFTK